MNRTVVMTCWNRPDYLRRSLQSWQRVRGLADWGLTVQIDHSSIQQRMAGIVREMIPDANLILLNERAGVLTAAWKAMNTGFDQGANYVVLAEEDVLVATDVLEYQGWAADLMHSQECIALACSFSAGPGVDDEVVELQTFNPLIWGIDFDMWDCYFRDSWDHDYSTGDDGREAGWDWNIRKRLMPKHRLTALFPTSSRSQHIGRDGGAHCTPEMFPGTVSPSWKQHRNPVEYRLTQRLTG